MGDSDSKSLSEEALILRFFQMGSCVAICRLLVPL